MNMQAQILARMERLEGDRINIGIYDGVLSLSEIAEFFVQKKGQISHSEDDVQRCLDDLVAQQSIIKVSNGYRTRIAETVRLLFLLRQRFWSQRNIQDAALLIEDIRVEFRQRRRPRRNQCQLKDALPPYIRSENKTNFLNSIPFSTCSGFQQRALTEIVAADHENNCHHKNFLVAGDTGAGKTEAFLFPILLSILQESSDIQSQKGVRAFLIYPRIRLALNQLRRLIRLTAELQKHSGRRLTIGIQNGRIPKSCAAMNGRKVDFLDGCLNDDCSGSYYFKESDRHLVDEGTPTVSCSRCGHIIDNLQITQASLRRTAPDFLVITDVSLNQWLSRSDYAHLFGLWGAENYLPPRFLVLDEVHLYERMKGAHISRLIRRFKARVALTYQNRPELTKQIPIVVGVSATLNDEESFLRKLVHVREDDASEQMVIIKPREEELELMDGRERYLFLLPRGLSPTPSNPEFRVNDQTVAIQTMMVLMHNLKEVQDWKGLAFFDSINDLMQFSRNYDPRQGEGNAHLDRSANFQELWRIRTDKRKPNQIPYSNISRCGPNCARQNNTSLTLCRCFTVGDYWAFSHHGWNQPLTVSAPVHAGGQKSLANVDVIPSSPSLEVGYDDSSVQLVYQHKAPPNPAAFIQRRGRAGRDPNDSPVIATLLWPYRNDDLFYFYHPETLYDPKFDDIPLNPSNVNVQRSQSIQAYFDVVAAFSRAYPQSGLRDFTKIGAHFMTTDHSNSQRLPDKYNEGGYCQVLSFDDNRKDIWLRESHSSFQSDGPSFKVKASWGLFKDCFDRPLEQEKRFVDSKISNFNQFLVQHKIIDASFESHRINPFFGIQGRLPELFRQFGRKEHHLKTYNWVQSYVQVDWMLKGSWNDSSVIIDISPDQPPRYDQDSRDMPTDKIPLDFGVSEFIPGNVSHRLRQEGVTHWTPLPKNGESTFEFSDEQLDRCTPFDLAQGSESLLAVPNFLRELSPKLMCISVPELPVREFSSTNRDLGRWYYVPDTDNDGHCERSVSPQSDWVPVSDKSQGSVQSVIVPFIAQNGGQIRKNIGYPMNVLFASAEGYLVPNHAMLGYYEVMYEYHSVLKIDLKDHDNIEVDRKFYLPKLTRDPIFLTQKVETQGICFGINSDIVNATHQRIQQNDSIRFSLRCKLLEYLVVSNHREFSAFYQSLKVYTRIAREYLCTQVIPQQGVRPLTTQDIPDLVQFYARHYASDSRADRVKTDNWAQFLRDNPNFLDCFSTSFEQAFKDSEVYTKFVQSVMYHSLASCLKMQLSRLGGLASSELLAFTDMSIFDMVDDIDLPRIMILERASGGTGGLLQAFERLEIHHGHHSLWASLQHSMGRCPIADGERLVSAVLASATVEQLMDLQENMSLDNVRQLLIQLRLDRTENHLVRYLARVLVKNIFVTSDLRVHISLLRKELLALQESLNQEYGIPVSDEFVLLHAAKNISSDRPNIQELSSVLQNEHQLYLQLKSVQPNQCVDGCPICVGTSSDIAPRVVADVFNSRQVLSLLRSELNSTLPKGSIEQVESLLQDGPVVIDQTPPLSGDTYRESGVECFTHLDDNGQVHSATTVVVDPEAFNRATNWKYGSAENFPYELRNGTTVRSRAEFIIGTQFLDEQIPFKYEPEVEMFDQDIGDFVTIRPDFVIHFNGRKIYVEYWGLDTSEYQAKRAKKEYLYATNPDLPLLSLESNDVENKVFLTKLREQFASE